MKILKISCEFDSFKEGSKTRSAYYSIYIEAYGIRFKTTNVYTEDQVKAIIKVEKMEYIDFYETDSLVEMIIDKGLPIPIFNYDKRKYQVDQFESQTTEKGKTTLVCAQYHDNFKEACIATLNNANH